MSTLYAGDIATVGKSHMDYLSAPTCRWTPGRRSMLPRLTCGSNMAKYAPDQETRTSLGRRRGRHRRPGTTATRTAPFDETTDPKYTDWKRTSPKGRSTAGSVPTCQGKPAPGRPTRERVVHGGGGAPATQKYPTPCSTSRPASAATRSASRAALDARARRGALDQLRRPQRRPERAVRGPHGEHRRGRHDDLRAADVPDGWEAPLSFPRGPRGVLSHWSVIEDGKIKNYQASPLDLERLPAQRPGRPRPLRGGADRDPRGGPREAAGDHPDHPLLRPLPRLRDPSRRQGQKNPIKVKVLSAHVSSRGAHALRASSPKQEEARDRARMFADRAARRGWACPFVGRTDLKSVPPPYRCPCRLLLFVWGQTRKSCPRPSARREALVLGSGRPTPRRGIGIHAVEELHRRFAFDEDVEPSTAERPGRLLRFLDGEVDILVGGRRPAAPPRHRLPRRRRGRPGIPHLRIGIPRQIGLSTSWRRRYCPTPSPAGW